MLTLLVLIAISLTLSGCSTRSYAPVVVMGKNKPAVEKKSKPRTAQNRPDNYLIRSGDTLYSIAWRYGLDYRSLARWNGIRAPYLIRAGASIRLRPETRNTKTRTSTQKKPEKNSLPADKRVSKENTRKLPAKQGPLSWQWPTKGKLVHNTTPFGKKGVEIYGKPGQAINAAAAGEVVYSGSGLVGYGKLIIIKHSEVYLSAYGHNSVLLVKEGDRVKTGQKIATMGKSGTTEIKLHFEIRKNGEPIKPEKVLPRLSRLKNSHTRMGEFPAG